jgi:uncharacterized membrane protein
MKSPKSSQLPKSPSRKHAFRAAVFRGLGVLLPPLLTVLVLIWVVNTVKFYVLEPVKQATCDGIVWFTGDIRNDLPGAKPGEQTASYGGMIYRRMEDGSYIPQHIYERVRLHGGPQGVAGSGEEVYRRYVELAYLKPYLAIPLFLSLFLLLLYLLGKFIAFGVGGYFAHMVEGGIRRLPVVRNVYSAAKQISDFLFSEREFEFTRIVAVEHPRRGVWSVGFVTGEGLPEVRKEVDEPLVTVLIPYSPLPITGCTIIVRKSECIDLDITFDQACEYIVSCGVVGTGEKPPRLPGDQSDSPSLLE